jgi:sigma-70-like protein
VMDFRGGMTQAQIGRRLRISQMHVSRLRAHALGYLRSRVLDLEGTRANAGPAVAPQAPKGHESAIGADRLCGGLPRGTAGPGNNSVRTPRELSGPYNVTAPGNRRMPTMAPRGNHDIQ